MTQARLGYAGLPLLKRPQGVSYKRDKNNIQARLCPKDQTQRVRLQLQRMNQLPAPVERSEVAAPGTLNLGHMFRLDTGGRFRQAERHGNSGRQGNLR